MLNRSLSLNELAAEGKAKQTIKADIPRYIISKLGLNRDPLAGKMLNRLLSLTELIVQ